MITITIPPLEGYNERTDEFVIMREEKTFSFEHSLISLTKWEAKYKKPFLDDNGKTTEQILDYYSMMCLEDGFDNTYITNDVVKKLSEYMADTQTATTITPRPNETHSRRIMTSEVIYAYMANGSVWKECETWPLQKLMTLLGVLGELNNPPEEMPEEDIYEQNRRLNEERRKQYNTKG